jgi:hypothetical protein
VYRKIGDAMRAQGDLAGAKEAYRSSLAILEDLADFHPDNAELQRHRAEALDVFSMVNDALESSPVLGTAIKHPSLHEALERWAERRAAASAPPAERPGAEKAAAEIPGAEELGRTRSRVVVNDPTARLVENIPRKMRVGAPETLKFASPTVTSKG